jgi:hypothetical protein
MHVEPVESFEDLRIKLVNRCGYRHEWIFRGQSNSSWSLIPKIGRANFWGPDDLNMFASWCRRVTAHTNLPKNEWERYAVAQHHGLATRLMDWSFNPLIATYFAVSSNFDKAARVYCHQFDHRDMINTFEEHLGSVSRMAPFLPSAYSNRIAAQSGLFTYHFEPNIPMESENGDLFAVEISFEQKSQFLLDLNFFAINEATVFPDEDGVSRHLNWWRSNHIQTQRDV